MGLTLPLPESGTTAILFLVADATLQNRLFGELLQDRLNFPCRVVPQCPIDEFETSSTDPRKIILLDYSREGVRGIKETAIYLSSLGTEVYGLVINVPRDDSTTIQFLQWGLRGAFYLNDSFRHLVKGIAAVLKDELWFTRQTLYQYIDGESQREVHGESKEKLISLREKEILQALQLGKSNDEIAEMLSISPHTVKNHLTKIYKKLGVANRLQAIFWSSKNF